MRVRIACVLIAAWAACGGAAAQGTAMQPIPAAPCPTDGRDVPLEALFGSWEARFDGIPGIAKVRLSRHPEYAGVRGTVTRDRGTAPPSVAQLAGDIDDDGVLNIDESQDGRSISRVWTAELQSGSCGRAFKGTWRDASDGSTHPLLLNKTGSWQ